MKLHDNMVTLETCGYSKSFRNSSHDILVLKRPWMALAILVFFLPSEKVVFKLCSFLTVCVCLSGGKLNTITKYNAIDIYWAKMCNMTTRSDEHEIKDETN